MDQYLQNIKDPQQINRKISRRRERISQREKHDWPLKYTLSHILTTEIQDKTMVRYNFVPTKWAQMNKLSTKESNGISLHIADTGPKIVTNTI